MNEYRRALLYINLAEREGRSTQEMVDSAFKEDNADNIIEELLKRGMSPNIQTEYGNILQSAILYNNPDVVQVLIENNVDPFQIDAPTEMAAMGLSLAMAVDLGRIPPLEIAKRVDPHRKFNILGARRRDKIIELLEDYIRIIMLHQSKQRLSLAKGFEDEGSLFRDFKREDHLMDDISNYIRLNLDAIDRSIKEQLDDTQLLNTLRQKGYRIPRVTARSSPPDE